MAVSQRLGPRLRKRTYGVGSVARVKTDFKTTLDGYRARQGDFQFVDIPARRYVMVDGHGDPNTSSEYADALAALYPVAYAVKFASKNELDRDYVVPPLEGLWWAADMTAFTSARDKSRWHWTLLLLVPDWIEPAMVDDSIDKVARKAPPTALDRVRLETLTEGTCVQTLHIGSYDDEATVLADLHDRFIPNEGFRMSGKHHEIYLSDARRVEPSRLRTILRQPVQPAR